MKSIFSLMALALVLAFSGAQDMPTDPQSQTADSAADAAVAPSGMTPQTSIVADSAAVSGSPAVENPETPPSTPAEQVQPPVPEQKTEPAQEQPQEKPEEKPGEPGKDKVSYNLSISSVTIEGQQWTRLNFRPDIPLGPFGVALDLELFLDNEGQISSKGYQFDNAEQAVESILRRIYYVRFHKPGEKIYARVGALDNVTLGYGLVVNGYNNTLDYPEIKKLGVNFELNDITRLGFGLQTFINNVEDFRNSGAVIGTRLSVKPLKPMDIPIFKNLNLGMTYVTDLNQYAGLWDRDGDSYPNEIDDFPDQKTAFRDDNTNGLSDDAEVGTVWDFDNDGKADSAFVFDHKPYLYPVMKNSDDLENERKDLLDRFSLKDASDAFSMLCFDLGVPIINSNLLNFTVYGQYALNLDDKDVSGKAKGWGTALPGFLLKIWKLQANLEFRHFEGRFSSEYFGNLYEHKRVQFYGKTPVVGDARLDSVSLNGVFGRLGLDLIGILSVSGNYQNMFGDTLSNQQIGFNAGPGAKVMDVINKIPMGPMKLKSVGGFLEKQCIGGYDLNAPRLKLTNDSTKYDKPKMDGFFDPTPYLYYGFEAAVEISQGVGVRWRKIWTHSVDPANGKIVPDVRVSIESYMSF